MGDEIQYPGPPNDPSFIGEESTRRFLADLMTDICRTLVSATLTEDDRHRLAQSDIQITAAFEELAKQLEPLRVGNPKQFTAVYVLVHQLMLGTFNAGAVCTISDSARDFIKRPFKDAGRNTGKKRGQQLTVDADARWRTEAREIWQQKRAPGAHRPMSQDALAREITSRIPSAPGHAQIVKFIRSLDHSPK